MRFILKAILIILGILGTLFIGFLIFLHFAFDGLFTGPTYNKSDLIANYENRKSEIIDVRDYYKSILPENKSVSIEFGKGKDLKIFHFRNDSIYESNWNLKIGTPKVDSILNELKWTENELNKLQEKLKAANCISIGGSEPTVIGWQRSVMGKFSYVIFNQNLNEEKIQDYNDGCTNIFYKDNVVLEYGGGAIGMQCFAEFYENKETKRKGSP